MPRAAPSSCAEHGCPTLCQGTARCPEHTKSRPKAKPTDYRVQSNAFYNSPTWRKLSKAHKRRNPLCAHCAKQDRTAVGDVTDHIIEISDDWSMRLEPSNLQTLCTPCHAKKTAEAKRSRGGHRPVLQAPVAPRYRS